MKLGGGAFKGFVSFVAKHGYIIATVHVRGSTPSIERPRGHMDHPGGRREYKCCASVPEPIGQLHVLRALESGIKSTGFDESGSGKRGIGRIELPRRTSNRVERRNRRP
jgi:hypothetical protein